MLPKEVHGRTPKEINEKFSQKVLGESFEKPRRVSEANSKEINEELSETIHGLFSEINYQNLSFSEPNTLMKLINKRNNPGKK